jgi:hypothetical protein
MLSKLLITFSLFVSLFVNQPTAAQPQTNQLQIYTTTITKVSYSEHDNTYYLYSAKDASNRFWVLAYPDTSKSLQQLKTDLIGHTIDIYYDIDYETDEGEEIDHYFIH